MLAGMRRRKSGTIVNISFVGGLVSFPMTGYYHASKYAVEGMSESLAMEVAPLGIKVMRVEPGPFRTDWPGRSLQKSDTTIPEYEDITSPVRQMYEDSRGKQAGDPVRAAEAIIAAMVAEHHPYIYCWARPRLRTLKRSLVRWRRSSMPGRKQLWERTSRGSLPPKAR